MKNSNRIVFRRMSIERRIFVTTAIIVLVMAIVAVVPFTLSEQVEVAFGALAEVAAREHAYEALIDTLEAFETNRRAYLLSGNAVFLQPYVAGLASLSSLRERLDALAPGPSPEGRARMHAIDLDLALVIAEARRHPRVTSDDASNTATADGRLAALKRRIAGEAEHAAAERVRWRERVTRTARMASGAAIVAGLANATILVLLMRGAGRALRARNAVRRRMRGAIHALQRTASAAEARSGLLHVLQSVSSLADTPPILARYLQTAYPDTGGAFYLSRTETGPLEREIAWGARAWPSSLRPGDIAPCAGTVKGAHAGPNYIPLLSQDRTIGAIALEDNIGVRKSASAGESIAQLAEQVALALANIDLRDRLRHQSFVDPLTQLYNRRFLDAAFALELERASRDGTSLSLVLIDLDHFKTINDDHGHDTGDVVLAAVGALLRNAVRGADVACRYGGEEMLVFMSGCVHADALARAEELRQRIAALVVTSGAGKRIRTSASFGISTYPEHGGNLAQLVASADTALYAAKQDGRNCVKSVSRQAGHCASAPPVAPRLDSVRQG